MTFILYNMRQHVDRITTRMAELLTDRWYDQLLKDIAQEEYDLRLKELRDIAKEKTKVEKEE